MQKIQIVDGVVVNLIEVDPAAVPDWAADWPDVVEGVDIGWQMTEGGGFTPPPSPAVTTDQVNAERDRRVAQGLTVVLADGTQVPILGDTTTKTNLQGLTVSAQLRIAAGEGAMVTSFRDRENVMHDLTQAQVLELWSASMDFVSEVFAASWALKDDFEAIPADYTKDSYWPSV
ncbi:DUF4376 domain-containing protein [Ferrimonas balearica]|nr:DUF4376 domain-containing protein [Ferrimonas balearica]